MHELGIVFYIIRDVKKAALENAVEHVSAVVMNIGEVSTVVEPLLRGCELKVNTIPAITRCDNCGEEYETVRYGRTCPHCNSDNTWLLQGNEVEIKEIEVT